MKIEGRYYTYINITKSQRPVFNTHELRGYQRIQLLNCLKKFFS